MIGGGEVSLWGSPLVQLDRLRLAFQAIAKVLAYAQERYLALGS
jgi:hypothetical protein